MENSSSSEPPLCPCGFWGSPKTLGLCSKCYNDHIARSSETLNGSDPRGGSHLGGGAGRTQAVVVPGLSVPAKMDNSSQHCPSRSSADSLGKQPGGCPDEQKDPKALPSSCASSSAAPAEDRTPSPVIEAGGSCAPPAKSVKEDVAGGSVTEGASVAQKVMTKEESAPPSSSQTVERCKGEASQKSPELSGGCGGGSGGSGGGSELLAEPRVPSPHATSGTGGGLSSLGKDGSPLKLASSTENSSVSSQGTKRSHEGSVDEEGAVKQKNKKRCFRCSTKLELAQREIGRCRCGGVFCSTHRHPEAHGCDFDHKEDGRREARQKMVKPTRHLGTSFRRLENS